MSELGYFLTNISLTNLSVIATEGLVHQTQHQRMSAKERHLVVTRKGGEKPTSPTMRVGEIIW